MSNVVQEGKSQKARWYYLFWLGGIIIAVIKMVHKYFKNIDWLELIPFVWTAIIASFLWQTQHNYYPGDLSRGIAGWMFFRQMILTTKLFFGGVLEDILIFHPFGLTFGYLLAIHAFQIFKPVEKESPILKPLFLSLILTGLLSMAIFLDKSSLYSFIIFVAPGIPGILLYYKHINIKRFIAFFFSMLIFTFIWDFSSVVLPQLLTGDYTSACWIYIIKGVHSLLYNPNAFIFGHLPVAIDIAYPAGGMIFLTGFVGYFRYIRGKYACNKKC